jgi:hypothetical protein
VGAGGLDDSQIKDIFQYFHYHILQIHMNIRRMKIILTYHNNFIADENFELTMRDYLKDLIGLTIVKGMLYFNLQLFTQKVKVKPKKSMNKLTCLKHLYGLIPSTLHQIT